MATLSLWCLVDGQSTSRAFLVQIAPDSSVDQLKDKIKEKKANEFSDVDADMLNLWRVSIPVVRADRQRPIVLNDLESSVELDPTDDVSDVFKEEPSKKTIHIIIQFPPPGNATHCSMQAFQHFVFELLLLTPFFTHPFA
jgi:hypothetical protein